MNRAAALLLLCLAACSSSEIAPAPPPPVHPSRPKGVDGPGDAERRTRFLSGTTAADAAALVATNNPAHLDAVAAFFVNAQKPYPERLAALAALRSLRTQDPGEYARLFPVVRTKLWEEVSHSVGLAMTPENEKAFVDAIGWLTDQKDPAARLHVELHLDRETRKRKPLPEPALCAAALSLASYPESESAKETLWAALQDPKEIVTVRACCLKALKSFHPRDLESRVVQLVPQAGDDWLINLQKRLR
jgi:hypothetical protein